MNLSFLLLISCFFITSCNRLTPVYRQNHLLSSELSGIELQQMPGTIEGAEFYHYFTSILPKTDKTKYLLTVQITGISFPSTIEKNSDVIRIALALSLNYQLLDINTHKILTSGQFRDISSYNTASTAYAADVEREGAQIALVRRSAEELRNKLILFLTKSL